MTNDPSAAAFAEAEAAQTSFLPTPTRALGDMRVGRPAGAALAGGHETTGQVTPSPVFPACRPSRDGHTSGSVLAYETDVKTEKIAVQNRILGYVTELRERAGARIAGLGKASESPVYFQIADEIEALFREEDA